MVFVRKVLTSIVDEFTRTPRLGELLRGNSFLKIDRTGMISSLEVGSRDIPFHLFAVSITKNNNHYSTKQVEKFNSMGYNVRDIIEYIESPEKLVAHLIAISLKEDVWEVLKFAAIDSSGKVYAYSNLPRYDYSLGKWSGNTRTYICRLGRLEFRYIKESNERIFHLRAKCVTPYTGSFDRPYHRIPSPHDRQIVEMHKAQSIEPNNLISNKETPMTTNISEHIQMRVNIIASQRVRIEQLHNQIANAQTEILNLKGKITNIEAEITTLTSAAKIMGIENG
ncbi:MAG: hypothetical protein WC358_08570 [Ignavibacteria bacterium]|jgi:hypothetical protein